MLWRATLGVRGRPDWLCRLCAGLAALLRLRLLSWLKPASEARTPLASLGRLCITEAEREIGLFNTACGRHGMQVHAPSPLSL